MTNKEKILDGLREPIWSVVPATDTPKEELCEICGYPKGDGTTPHHHHFVAAEPKEDWEYELLGALRAIPGGVPYYESFKDFIRSYKAQWEKEAYESGIRCGLEKATAAISSVQPLTDEQAQAAFKCFRR